MRRYCGRNFSPDEIRRISCLVEEDPSRTRAELSRLVCKVLDWRKPNGGLKDMSCRVAMLRMNRDGLIPLPPPTRQKPVCKITPGPRTDPRPFITARVHELPSLRLKRVLTSKESSLWNEYIQRYHYLGHTLVPGAQLRYFALSEAKHVALLSFSASAWQVASRDCFIGWSHEQRKRNLHLIINNSRFLILPWVRSKGLASKIPAMAARQVLRAGSKITWHFCFRLRTIFERSRFRKNIKIVHYYSAFAKSRSSKPDTITKPKCQVIFDSALRDWDISFGYCPALIETFVEKKRFKGTCYKAANWVRVGQTKGRGKLGPSGKVSVPIKDIWLYPLTRKFRAFLTL